MTNLSLITCLSTQQARNCPVFLGPRDPKRDALGLPRPYLKRPLAMDSRYGIGERRQSANLVQAIHLCYHQVSKLSLCYAAVVVEAATVSDHSQQIMCYQTLFSVAVGILAPSQLNRNCYGQVRCDTSYLVWTCYVHCYLNTC